MGNNYCPDQGSSALDHTRKPGERTLCGQLAARASSWRETRRSCFLLSLNVPLTASSSSSVLSPLWRKAHTYHIVITTNFRLVISPANIIIHGSLHHWVLFSVLFESNHGAHYHQESMVWVLLPFVEKEEDLGE